MPLTRDFKETVMAPARCDPEFRGDLLIEVTDAFLAGDIDTGKALLRDYRNATADHRRRTQPQRKEPATARLPTSTEHPKAKRHNATCQMEERTP